MIRIGLVHPYQLTRKSLKIVIQDEENFHMEVEHQSFQPQCSTYEEIDILLIDGHHYNKQQESAEERTKLHLIRVVLFRHPEEGVDRLQGLQLGVYCILMNSE